METIIQAGTTFYQDANFVVTQSRYVTNSKTYAMRDVSPVHGSQIAKRKTGPMLIALIGSLMMFGNNVSIVGSLMFAAGVAAILMIKVDHAVRVSTNAGEANSLVFKDLADIPKVVDALNDAVVNRGLFMKVVLIWCLLVSSVGCTGSQEVYVCRGRYALRYHQRRDCMGLRNCTYRVDKIAMAEAVALGRTPCHLEYHLSEK